MFKSNLLAAFILSSLVGLGVSAQQTPTTSSPAPQKTPAPVASQTPVTTPAPAQKPLPATPAATTAAPASKLVRTADGHELAPLEEQTLNYKDWTFKSLRDGAPVNLREWLKGKKLALVVYYAPWCGNWRNEAPIVARLYDKYKQHGFDVIAVNEYGSTEDARQFFATAGTSYTVVVESEGREAREQTTHYAYRQACADPRRWGSPFNVFLEPSKLNKQGDVLTEKAWVVGGELVEADIEPFIREHLGLKEKAAVEPCADEKKTSATNLLSTKKQPR